MRYSDILFGADELSKEYARWYVHPEMNNGDNAAFNMHMPVLRLLSYSKRVVELGSRFGTSTLAIIAGKPQWLMSYDIQYRDTIGAIGELAQTHGVDFTFTEADDLTIEIPNCDILFIDTLHTGDQLRQELALHADKAAEYIIGHDLVSFGDTDEIPTDNPNPGLIPPLEQFLKNNPQWESASYWFSCNGLWVLRRKF